MKIAKRQIQSHLVHVISYTLKNIITTVIMLNM